MVVTDEYIQQVLNIRKEEKAIEYRVMVERFNLNDLKPFIEGD